MFSLIKKLVIYLDEPTYFSKDSKTLCGDDTWLHKML